MQELIRETISHDLLERYINEWLSVSNTSHNWKRLHQILINMNDSISEAMGVDTSIYANNGTLAGNRVVTGNGKSLQFAGVAGFSVVSSTLISLTATQTLTFNSSATTTFNVNSLHLNINSNSGNAGDVIMADGAGTCSWQPVVGGGPSVNIYNANGALTSNRTLSGDDNELLFTNLTKFSIDNTDEINLIGTTSSINSTDFTIEATNPYLITGSTAASLAGSPLVALTSASGNFGFAAYALPTSLGVGDDGKILQYDHGTTSFVMASAGVDTNIYTTNGTLTGARVLTGATNPLTFTGLSTFTLSAGALFITALTGATTFTSASTFTINSGVDLVLNVTGEVTITQALNHDTAPDSIVALTGTGTGTLSYITLSELLTASGAVNNNIYAGNGTLASNRTVSGGGLYSIAFNNTTASTFTSNGLTTIGSNVEIDLLSSTVDILTGTLGFKSTASAVNLRLSNFNSAAAGTLVQAVTANTGEVRFTPYKLPTSLGAGDDGKGLVYNHSTTSFVMTPVADTNFAEDDLTFTGNRTHDADGNDLHIIGISNMLQQSDITTLTTNVTNPIFSINAALSNIVASCDEGTYTYDTVWDTTGVNIAAKLTATSAIQNAIMVDAGSTSFYTALGAGTLRVEMPQLPIYSNNANAISGGLSTGTIYKTATGELRIVV